MELKWENIKNGFRGFEALAYDYVDSEYAIADVAGKSLWERTKETRDGNRDAYSIILGFQPSALCSEEWWMEAKYSTKQERMTRYRLDATIVSAAIHGRVTKLIFVTNIDIGTKAIVDIRNALKHAIHCTDVHFCTKPTLEFWLANNKDIFVKYFDEKDFSLLLPQPLFLYDEIEFYSGLKCIQSFSEPLHQLQTGRDYHLYFSVFSDKKRILTLKIGSYFTGVSLLSPDVIELKEGINYCTVLIHIENFYEMKSYLADGRCFPSVDSLNGALLALGELDIITKQASDITVAESQYFALPSQQAIEEKLATSLYHFQRDMQPMYHAVYGASGIGKSHLMRHFADQNLQSDRSFFQATFSNDGIQNDILVYQLLLFFLFPYLPPSTVDKDYLDKLNSENICSSFFYRVVAAALQPDRLHKIYIACDGEDIFPSVLQVNERIVILDDIQHLSEDTAHFLYIILKELYRKEQPIFLILNGWPQMVKTKAYGTLKDVAYIHEYAYNLSHEDMTAAIKQCEKFQFNVNPELFPVIFPSVIDLLQFLRYRQDVPIENLKEFVAASHLFLNAELTDAYLIDIFNKSFSCDLETKNFCMQIYWYINGIDSTMISQRSRKKLFQNNLIRYSEDGLRIIPYHDRYQRAFRNQFRYDTNILMSATGDVPADLRNTLLFNTNEIDLNKACSQIMKWKAQGRFYSLLYVLEGIFENSEQEELRFKLGSKHYYDLFLAYGFGIANGSRSKSGYKVFQKIEEETRSSADFQVQLVRQETIFELINSSFEHLQHDSTKKFIEELKQLTTVLQSAALLPHQTYQSEKYLLTRQIELLLASEYEESQTCQLYQEIKRKAEEFHFNYEWEFIQLRYAETLYFRDTDYALQLAKDSRDRLYSLRGEQEKFYLWAKMDCAFLDIVLQGRLESWEEMGEAHQAMKQDYFNDYRKRILAMASVYLHIGMISPGSSFLFSEVTAVREMRPRQKAFYYETLALYHFLQAEYAEALSALSEAESIFSDIPSYLAVIQHNQQLLSSDNFKNGRTGFAKNGQLPAAVYCIDPRCIW